MGQWKFKGKKVFTNVFVLCSHLFFSLSFLPCKYLTLYSSHDVFPFFHFFFLCFSALPLFLLCVFLHYFLLPCGIRFLFPLFVPFLYLFNFNSVYSHNTNSQHIHSRHFKTNFISIHINLSINPTVHNSNQFKRFVSKEMQSASGHLLATITPPGGTCGRQLLALCH